MFIVHDQDSRLGIVIFVMYTLSTTYMIVINYINLAHTQH